MPAPSCATVSEYGMHGVVCLSRTYLAEGRGIFVDVDFVAIPPQRHCCRESSNTGSYDSELDSNRCFTWVFILPWPLAPVALLSLLNVVPGTSRKWGCLDTSTVSTMNLISISVATHRARARYPRHIYYVLSSGVVVKSQIPKRDLHSRRILTQSTPSIPDPSRWPTFPEEPEPHLTDSKSRSIQHTSEARLRGGLLFQSLLAIEFAIAMDCRGWYTARTHE